MSDNPKELNLLVERNCSYKAPRLASQNVNSKAGSKDAPNVIYRLVIWPAYLILFLLTLNLHASKKPRKSTLPVVSGS